MDEDLILIKQLDEMRYEHRRLDEQAKDPALDEFTLKRIKTVKADLRYKIAQMEQIVYPDIIA